MKPSALQLVPGAGLLAWLLSLREARQAVAKSQQSQLVSGRCQPCGESDPDESHPTFVGNWIVVEDEYFPCDADYFEER
jgi:hypothetical protein